MYWLQIPKHYDKKTMRNEYWKNELSGIPTGVVSTLICPTKKSKMCCKPIHKFGIKLWSPMFTHTYNSTLGLLPDMLPQKQMQLL